MTSSSQSEPVRVVFTEGGKGGVGKTEAAVCLATWYQRQGIIPKLIDFGAEINPKGCLSSFFPDAVKLDTRESGTLDHFFGALDATDGVVLADMSAGAGAATQRWLEKSFADLRDMNIRCTAICVTTNEPGAINAVLQSAKRLQNRVDYLVVLNEMHCPRNEFHYWHHNPDVERFIDVLHPSVIRMRSRGERFQAEVRNHAFTLEAIMRRQVVPEFFRYSRNIAHARHCLRQIYAEFGTATDILLPPNAAAIEVIV